MPCRLTAPSPPRYGALCDVCCGPAGYDGNVENSWGPPPAENPVCLLAESETLATVSFEGHGSASLMGRLAILAVQVRLLPE